MGTCNANGCDEWINEATTRYCSTICRVVDERDSLRKQVEEITAKLAEAEKERELQREAADRLQAELVKCANALGENVRMGVEIDDLCAKLAEAEKSNDSFIETWNDAIFKLTALAGEAAYSEGLSLDELVDMIRAKLKTAEEEVAGRTEEAKRAFLDNFKTHPYVVGLEKSRERDKALYVEQYERAEEAEEALKIIRDHPTPSDHGNKLTQAMRHIASAALNRKK